MERVTIIGLGLIGGSLGMALKKAVSNELEIVGYDADHRATSRAVKRSAIDRGENDLRKAVKDSQIVIISTPILAMEEVMKGLAPSLMPGAVVTDTASTKTRVMAWAEEHLSATVDFVGGHPLAGKEVHGVDNADPDLFSGATYCVIPSAKVSSRAVEKVTGLVERVGAVPFFSSAEEHDALVAAVSHLPLILASALVSLAAESDSWRELSRLASSGFRDTTRLASTDPSMSAGICLTNSEAIGHWVDRYIEELKTYKRLLGGSPEELLEKLARAREAREGWLSMKSLRTEGAPRPPIPSATEQMGSMFLGERLSRRAGEMLGLPKRKTDKPEEGSRE